MAPGDPVEPVPADPSGSLPADCEEAVSWGWFCGAHPHEAHAKDPDRFWEVFRKKCPGVPRSEMVRMLEYTAGDAEGGGK